MTRLALTVLVLLALACNRGPEPKPIDSDPAAAPANGEPPAAQAAPALPPAHPPIPGHPPLPGQPPAPSQAAAPAGEPSAGGLTWNAAEPFVARPPQSAMRAAEYVVEGNGGAAAVLTVYHFPGQGGTVQQNIDRWVGQFSQPDGRDSQKVAKLDKRQSGAIPVTVVSVTGTYTNAMPGMGGGAPEPGQRLLGAIAEGPQGPVFFKLTGPTAVVDAAEDGFNLLLSSLRPTS